MEHRDNEVKRQTEQFLQAARMVRSHAEATGEAESRGPLTEMELAGRARKTLKATKRETKK
jgi:hypothetical protein